jgi:hypothetical protein
MMCVKTILTSAVTIAFVATTSYAQDGTFRSWFDVPDTVMAGETFEVQMWASFEGELLRPEGWFAGASTSFEITGDLDSFSAVSTPTRSLMFLFQEGTPDANWLRDVFTGQVDMPGDFDPGNPLHVLSFNIETTANNTGILDINLRPHSTWGVPLLGWSIDDSDNYAETNDPNIALIATPASVRVIPVPGAGMLFALFGIGYARRRR